MHSSQSDRSDNPGQVPNVPGFPKPSSASARNSLRDRLNPAASSSGRPKMRFGILGGIEREGERISDVRKGESAFVEEEYENSIVQPPLGGFGLGQLDHVTSRMAQSHVVSPRLGFPSKAVSGSVVISHHEPPETQGKISPRVASGGEAIGGESMLKPPAGSVSKSPERQTKHNISQMLDVYKFAQVAEELASGKLEFCYVLADRTDPYKLKIIDKPLQGMRQGVVDYMTLSKNGVVRSWQENSECQSFAEFAREHIIYNSLMTLKFFKEYSRTKALLVWKKAVSSSRMKRNSTSLKSKLISISETFRDLHQYSVIACERIRNRNVINLEIGKVYKLQEFRMIQSAWQDKIAAANDLDIENLVAYMCDEGRKRLNPFLYPESATIAMWKDKMEVGQSSKPLSADAKLKDALSLEGEDSLSFSDKASIRSYCRKFASVLRLADYMIREALYESIETSLKKMVAAFIQTREKHNLNLPGEGAFEITLSVMPQEPEQPKGLPTRGGSIRGGPSSAGRTTQRSDNVPPIDTWMELRPSPEDVRKSFAEFSDQTLALGSHTESILGNDLLQDLLFPIISDIEQSTVLDDRMFADQKNNAHMLVSACTDILKSDVNEASAVIVNYQSFITCLNANAHYSYRLNHTYLEETEPKQTKNVLFRLKSEQEEAEVIPKSEYVGMIRLSLVEVRARPLKQVSICRSNLNSLIPEVFLTLAESTIERAYGFRRELSTKPPSLDAFIALLLVFKQACEEHEGIEACYKRDLSFMDVIETHKVPVGDSVGAKYKGLQNMFMGYKESKRTFTDNLENLTKEFRTILEKMAFELKPDIDDARKRASAKFLEQAASDHVRVLKHLDSLQKDLKILYTRGATIVRNQVSMSVICYDNAPVEEMIIECESNVILWQSVAQVRLTQKTFYTNVWSIVKCSEIKAELSAVLVALRRKVKRPNVDVQTWVEKTCNELLVFISCIGELQFPFLQPRHIEDIGKYLGSDIFKPHNKLTGKEGELWTVQDLIDINISGPEQLSEVHLMFERAQREHAIEQICYSCQSILAKLDFSTLKECERTLLYVSNFDAILTSIDECIIDLTASLSLKACEPYREPLEFELAKARRWYESLSSFKYLQSGYIRFKKVFSAARLAKYFAAGNTDFATLEETMKFIYRTAKDPARRLISDILDVKDVNQNAKFKGMVDNSHTALQRLENILTEYIDQQKKKWPKLYLLEDKTFLGLVCTADLWTMYDKVGPTLLPAVTNVIFDTVDRSTTIGIESNRETLNFQTPISSSRTQFIDWMKMIEEAVDTNVKSDIDAFRKGEKSVVEDALNSRTSDQSRLCAMELWLWSQFDRTTEKNAAERIDKITELIHKCSSLASGLKHDSTQIIAMRNLILCLAHHRDLVTMNFIKGKKIKEKTTSLSNSVLVQLSIKKVWDEYAPEGSQLTVCQGHLRSRYGYKYHGFGNRLAITPITEKYFFAINQSFHDLHCPYLLAKGGVRPELTKELAFELGIEILDVDCGHLLTAHDIYSYLRVAVGCGLWLSFLHTQHLEMNGLSSLSALLVKEVASVQNAIANNDEKINLGGISIVPKFVRFTILTTSLSQSKSMANNTSSISGFTELEFTLKKRFRPIFLWGPNRKELIRLLLMSCIPHLPSSDRVLVETRLLVFNSQVEIIAATENKETIMELIVRGIRAKGHEFSSFNSHIISKIIIDYVMEQIHNSLPDSNICFDKPSLRLLQNLYADYYMSDKDLKQLLHEPTEDAHHFEGKRLAEMIHSPLTCVLVCGNACVGKSSLIKSVSAVLDQGHDHVERIYGIHQSFGSEKNFTSLPKLLSASSLERTSILNGEHWTNVLEETFSALINDIPAQKYLLVHIDCPTSRSCNQILEWLSTKSVRWGLRVRALVEVPTLAHINPLDLINGNVVYIKPGVLVDQNTFARSKTADLLDRKLVTEDILSICRKYIIDPIIALVQDKVSVQPWHVDSYYQLIIILVEAVCALTLPQKATDDQSDSHTGECVWVSSEPIDLISFGRVCVYAGCIVCRSLISNNSVLLSAFDENLMDLFASKASVEQLESLNLSPLLPSDFHSDEFYLREDATGDELYRWALWSETCTRVIDDIEDVPMFNLPDHMKGLAPHSYPNIVSFKYPFLDPASVILPSKLSSTVWCLHNAILSARSVIHFNIYGDIYSGRTSLLRFIATHKKKPTRTSKNGSKPPLKDGESDHWAVYLKDNATEHDLQNSIEAASHSHKPIEIACDLYNAGVIYIDDLNYQYQNENQDCFHEMSNSLLEAMRYIYATGEVWNRNKVIHTNVRGVSSFVTTTPTTPATPLTEIRALRSCVPVACACDITNILLSKICQEVIHINIDVIIDTMKAYKLVIENFKTLTMKQPDLTDEFGVITCSRATLASVVFLMENFACSTEDIPSLMPIDAIKFASLCLCDYRSMFEVSKKQVEDAVELIAKENFRFPNYGDNFVKQTRQKAIEKVIARKSSILVKKIDKIPKEPAAGPPVSQGVGKSLIQVRTDALATQKSKQGPYELALLEDLEILTMEFWKYVKLVESSMKFKRFSAIILGGGSLVESTHAVDIACGNNKDWDSKRLKFTGKVDHDAKVLDNFIQYLHADFEYFCEAYHNLEAINAEKVKKFLENPYGDADENEDATLEYKRKIYHVLIYGAPNDIEFTTIWKSLYIALCGDEIWNAVSQSDPTIFALWQEKQGHMILSISESVSYDYAISSLASYHPILNFMHIYQLPNPSATLDNLTTWSHDDKLEARASIRSAQRLACEDLQNEGDKYFDLQNYISSSAYRTGTVQCIAKINRKFSNYFNPQPIVPRDSSKIPPEIILAAKNIVGDALQKAGYIPPPKLSHPDVTVAEEAATTTTTTTTNDIDDEDEKGANGGDDVATTLPENVSTKPVVEAPVATCQMYRSVLNEVIISRYAYCLDTSPNKVDSVKKFISEVANRNVFEINSDTAKISSTIDEHEETEDDVVEADEILETEGDNMSTKEILEFCMKNDEPSDNAKLLETLDSISEFSQFMGFETLNSFITSVALAVVTSGAVVLCDEGHIVSSLIATGLFPGLMSWPIKNTGYGTDLEPNKGWGVGNGAIFVIGDSYDSSPPSFNHQNTLMRISPSSTIAVEMIKYILLCTHNAVSRVIQVWKHTGKKERPPQALVRRRWKSIKQKQVVVQTISKTQNTSWEAIKKLCISLGSVCSTETVSLIWRHTFFEISMLFTNKDVLHTSVEAFVEVAMAFVLRVLRRRVNDNLILSDSKSVALAMHWMNAITEAEKEQERMTRLEDYDEDLDGERSRSASFYDAAVALEAEEGDVLAQGVLRLATSQMSKLRAAEGLPREVALKSQAPTLLNSRTSSLPENRKTRVTVNRTLSSLLTSEIQHGLVLEKEKTQEEDFYEMPAIDLIGKPFHETMIAFCSQIDGREFKLDSKTLKAANDFDYLADWVRFGDVAQLQNKTAVVLSSDTPSKKSKALEINSNSDSDGDTGAFELLHFNWTDFIFTSTAKPRVVDSMFKFNSHFARSESFFSTLSDTFDLVFECWHESAPDPPVPVPPVSHKFLWLLGLMHAALGVRIPHIIPPNSREEGKADTNDSKKKSTTGKQIISASCSFLRGVLANLTLKGIELTNANTPLLIGNITKDALLLIYSGNLLGKPSLKYAVALLDSFFTDDWCDENEEYSIQGVAKLPPFFSIPNCRQLTEILRSHAAQGLLAESMIDIDGDGEFDMVPLSDVQLSGCSYGVVNEKARVSVINLLARVGLDVPWSHGISERCFASLSIMGATDIAHIKVQFANAAKSICDALPMPIDLDSPEFAATMALKNQSTTFVPEIPFGHDSGGDDSRDISAVPMPPSVVGGSDVVIEPFKVYEETGIICTATRHIDPLWAYCLLEVKSFNDCVEHWRNGIIHGSRIAAQENNKDIIYYFRHGFIPTDWIHLSNDKFDNKKDDSNLFTDEKYDSYNQIPKEEDLRQVKTPILIEAMNAIQLLNQRRRRLTRWLTKGQPGAIRLSLLSNPEGLLHAVKERFAIVKGIPLAKISINASPLPVDLLNETIIDRLDKFSYGCSFVASDCGVRNAIISKSTRPKAIGSSKDEEYDISSAPASSMSSVEQSVHLHVFMSEEDKSKHIHTPVPDGEEIQRIVPTTLPLFASNWIHSLLKLTHEDISSVIDMEPNVPPPCHASLLQVEFTTEEDPARLEIGGACLITL